MSRRYDRSRRHWEDPAKVDPYCTVPWNASKDALRELLQDVFPNDTAAIRRYASPKAFNGLLDWTGGDLRWPIAAIILRFGLWSDHQVYETREIVRILDAGGLVAVQRVVVKGGGDQAYNKLLKDAHQRIRSAPPAVQLRNELRRAGLRSTAWTALARGSIYTLDELRREQEGDNVRFLRGIGPQLMSEIEEVLRPK